MHRIDSDDADGLFKVTPPPATRVTPEWANDVQENLCNVIEAAGITLVKDDHDQLLEALRRLTARPGTISMWGGNAAPAGTLECDGDEVLIDDYPALYAAIGDTWGAASADHFRLPDMRGEFPRGWDHGRGVDAGRAFASAQAQSVESHDHGLPNRNNGSGGSNSINNSGGGGIPLTTDAYGGTETRPRNVAVMFVIQAV